MVFSYLGTGVFYINSKRVFSQVDSNGDVVQTLQDVIDVANEAMVDYVSENERISNENERISAENIRIPNEDIRITNEINRVNAEVIRDDSEDIRIANEIARVNAENLRVEDGALIKSGDTMNGTLNMGENEIQLGGFKIKHNPNLNSLDIEF